jgi:arabinogalactan oligomer/maltooligosaccharide transport system substrate-binding protein
MDRRTALKRFGGLATVGALAGCVGVQESGTETSGGSDGDGGGDSGGESTETETPEGPAGNATLWYARSDAEAKTLKGNIEAFNEQSRHSVEGSDLADLQKKLTSAVPAGQGPESFDWAHDLAGDYFERGFLSDQSDQLDVSLDQFTDTAQAAATYEDATIGLPFAAETVGLLYNKELVDEPPETLSEMKSIMEEHHDPGNNTYGLGYPINPYFISAWAHAFGGYYFDADADEPLGLSNEETIRGFELVIEDLFPYSPKDPAYGPQAAAFADGNAPFAINGPWYLGTIAEKGVDAGVAALPTPEGGEPEPLTGISLWYFTSQMEENEANATAARSFAEWYVTNEDLQMDLAETHGFIPVLDAIAQTDDLPSKVQGFSEAVAQGRMLPADPRMNSVWTPLENAFTNALNGDADLESAMTAAEEEIRSKWQDS